jgi:hypothetical protein
MIAVITAGLFFFIFFMIVFMAIFFHYNFKCVTPKKEEYSLPTF